MADPKRRHPANRPGAWFVDTTCIDCDASRQCAPDVFGIVEGQSVVMRQPETQDAILRATRALLACPTGSIGVEGGVPTLDGVLPEPIADDVYFLGFNSEKSFGANAYFARRAWGGVLVDSPRFVRQLVRSLEDLGGVSLIVLTHRDDVADAERYAVHFGARVAIHADDRSAAPFAREIVSGRAPALLAPRLLMIPVPGHTRGSVAALLDDTFLFTGDSLHHSRAQRRLSAFSDACWYSWDEQARSLESLLAHRFEWILPGHGNRRHDDCAVLHREITELVQRMRAREEPGDW